MANSLLFLLVLKIILKNTLQPGVWDSEWKGYSSSVGKGLFWVYLSGRCPWRRRVTRRCPGCGAREATVPVLERFQDSSEGASFQRLASLYAFKQDTHQSHRSLEIRHMGSKLEEVEEEWTCCPRGSEAAQPEALGEEVEGGFPIHLELPAWCHGNKKCVF